MKKFATLALAAASLVAVAHSASASGRLDAPEPVVRDYSIHVEIEPGYLSHEEIMADIRGNSFR